MKKTLLLSSALLLAVAVGARAHEGHGMHDMKDMKDAASGTYTGEVLDLACYFAHGAAGGDHQKCGKMCLTKDHTAAGLLTGDGKIYALVDDHKAMKAMQKVRELADDKVKITGHEVTKGGLQAIVVSDVQKL